MADASAASATPIAIKKYANRRLYNTASSSYVTLAHLAQMVKDGQDFVVRDAKTGEDITRSVLTQIIVEEESKGQNLLPIGFLRQLIRLYGDSLQALVPGYLDHSMDTFTRNQERMRSYMEEALGGLFPFPQIEEMGKQNVAMFEQAMKVFSPFQDRQDGAGNAPRPSSGTADAAAGAEDRIADLRARLEAMQKELDTFSGGKG